MRLCSHNFNIGIVADGHFVSVTNNTLSGQAGKLYDQMVFANKAQR